ncbi:MAG: AmmeMemoRadiSam system radical SAM enzyme [Candidatus Omnitrophota bacterium]
MQRESFKKINRRDFLKLCLGTTGYLVAEDVPELFAYDAPVEALHYIKDPKNTIKCVLCPHQCIISSGERGFCRARENKNGKLYSIVYGKLCAVHSDPIEKKPLFHVYPGSNSFSLASVGCNLRCKFCQNWQISQAKPADVQAVKLTSDVLVAKAVQSGCKTIAYTYTEPTVYYEYMLDVAKIAKKNNIASVLHSNGFINPDPLQELLPYVTAMNVDLKGFTNEYYAEICSGNLPSVLNSLKIIKQMDVWLELTNLVIPTLNDQSDNIKRMSAWILKELGDDVPVHFSRFFPMYKLAKLPPTTLSTLEQARNTAMSEGLKFVYIGNVPGHSAENTYCPNCNNMIIKRVGYSVVENNLINNMCSGCKTKISGVWS